MTSLRDLELNVTFQEPRRLVERAIADFGLIKSRRVVIGLSGGKDSLALLLCLASAGYEVIAATVDLGYQSFHAQLISQAISRLGFAVRVLAIDRAGFSHSPGATPQMIENVQKISDPKFVAPCGPCSQLKRHVLIEYCEHCGAEYVALGHHRDDFITTLLKDYFVERYYTVHGAFDDASFRDFVRTSDLDLRNVSAMVESGRAATMALSLELSPRVRLVRPLVYVAEAQIERLRDEFHLPIFGSGCSHEVFQDGQAIASTKREIVHAEWRRRLGGAPMLGDELLTLALRSLDCSGNPRTNPRTTRNARLPGFESR